MQFAQIQMSSPKHLLIFAFHFIEKVGLVTFLVCTYTFDKFLYTYMQILGVTNSVGLELGYLQFCIRIMLRDTWVR